MYDLIDRQGLLNKICDGCGYIGYCHPDGKKCVEYERVESMPSVQPERKVGKWVSRENEPKHRDWFSCSRCTGIFDYRWKFCPNCGAKMEGIE